MDTEALRLPAGGGSDLKAMSAIAESIAKSAGAWAGKEKTVLNDETQL